MGALEAFLAAAVTGFAFLLAAVALLAWRRASNGKMAVLGAGFLLCAGGGALLLWGEVAAGPAKDAAALGFPAAVLAMLVLLYAALFARRN